jgi:two-component system, chemotaxis family, response regulator Rcp1
MSTPDQGCHPDMVHSIIRFAVRNQEEIADMAAAKILVVEDNPGEIVLLRLALEDQGEDYELLVLDDGEQAIQFVEEQRLSQHEPEPCVILLDLRLPKRDGLEVLRAIRRNPVVGHLHVLVLTSIATPTEEAEIRSMGAEYRIKPRELSEYSRLAADAIAICKGLTRAAA